jgi:hypothetical protein
MDKKKTVFIIDDANAIISVDFAGYLICRISDQYATE